MSIYSIAHAKDNLSRLIDEVLEGKDVTITRHGKPVVEMRPAASVVPQRTTDETIEWLRQCRESLPKIDVDTVALVREMREDI